MGTDRRHLLTTLGAVILGSAAALVAVGATMDWLVVDVRVGPGHEGPRRLWFPVPVAALRLAAAAFPASGLDGPLPADVRERLPAIRRALEELAGCPDAELLRVTASGTSVRIAKRGRELALDVRAPDAAVHGTIPIPALVRAVRRLERSGSPPDSALAVLADGFELTVGAEDTTVRLAVR